MLILWEIINAVSILDKSRAIIIVAISIPVKFTEPFRNAEDSTACILKKYIKRWEQM